MPDGADAVLPLDAVTLRGGRAEAIAAVAPGEGVLAAGGDATPRTPLRRAGDHLRAIDIAVISGRGHCGRDGSRAAHPHRLWRHCPTPVIDAALTLFLRGTVSANGAQAERS